MIKNVRLQETFIKSVKELITAGLNVYNEMFSKQLCPNFTIILVVVCFQFCVNQSAAANAPNQVRPKPLWNATYTDKLKQDLLLNYDKFARPTQHYNITTVTIGITIMHVDIDEFKSTISVHSLMELAWEDEKLKWNSSNYGGLSDVKFADHEIWQPDIMLYNSATGSSVSHLGGTHCVVDENGNIAWIPPTLLVAFCDLNLRLWPFDSQSCYLKFGSWTYYGNQIDVNLKDPDLDNLGILIKNSEWQITSINGSKNVIYYTCCPEPYADVVFQLDLTRRSPAYKAIIIAPAFVIIMLTLMGFWLPSQAGEKIILNGCTAIIICIFMVYFTQKIPAMGSNIPLVVLFYSSSLYIVCCSMIISVAVITISRVQHNRPLPWIIKRPLIGWLGKILGLNQYITETSIRCQSVTAEEMRDHQITDFEEHQTNDDSHFIGTTSISLQQDWLLLATAIDRMAFIFYGFLFAILAIVYSI